MWRFVLAPLAAVLYGLYLRFVLVKYPQLEEPVRRKFVYIIGAVALVLIALDFALVR
jgi:cytochrome c oxidase assembly factor CtaG